MARTGRTLATLVGCWVLALTANRSLRRVRGGSMAPTLAEGDLVVTVPVRRPRRGDVVLLRDPRDTSHHQVKRVIGLAGEVVEIRGGTLLVDGRRHREAHQHGRGPDGRLAVPAGHVVVLGDARDASTDSRVYGPVPVALVDRRVPLVLDPLPRLLRSPPTPLGAATSDPERRSA